MSISSTISAEERTLILQGLYALKNDNQHELPTADFFELVDYADYYPFKLRQYQCLQQILQNNQSLRDALMSKSEKNLQILIENKYARQVFNTSKKMVACLELIHNKQTLLKPYAKKLDTYAELDQANTYFLELIEGGAELAQLLIKQETLSERIVELPKPLLDGWFKLLKLVGVYQQKIVSIAAPSLSSPYPELIQLAKTQEKLIVFQKKIGNHIQAILTKEDIYNEKLASIVTNYDMSRIHLIEKMICYLFYYEITELKADYKISIAEAVKLAKNFGDSKSYQFVNGVLDNIKIAE